LPVISRYRSLDYSVEVNSPFALSAIKDLRHRNICWPATVSAFASNQEKSHVDQIKVRRRCRYRDPRTCHTGICAIIQSE
jgi:hypothetical protein